MRSAPRVIRSAPRVMRSAPRPGVAALLLSTLAAASAQSLDFSMPEFLHDQQRFQQQLTESRWTANPMPYMDGLSSAVLQHPYTVLCDVDDTIFVTSFTLNHVVRLKMTTKQRAQYKVFVKGGELDGPVGMALDVASYNTSVRLLYVASFTNDHILRIDAETGDLLGKFGNEEEMDCPEGIALGPDGTLYVVSFLLPYIVRYQPESGRFLGQFAPPPLRGAPTPRRGPGVLLGAEDLAFDVSGDLHVTAYHASAVFKYNGNTGALETSYGKGVLRGPVGITCGPDGDMYVASYKDNQVMRFEPTGRFVGVAAGTTDQRVGKLRISGPAGIAFADDGTFFVTSHVAGTLTRFNSSTVPTRTWRVTGTGT